MILDYKLVSGMLTDSGDLYLSVPSGTIPSGFENKVEGDELLIINVNGFHIYKAILINTIELFSSGSEKVTFISREFNWKPLFDDNKIKELIRNFKLEDLGI
jgi:hypothetical protein